MSNLNTWDETSVFGIRKIGSHCVGDFGYTEELSTPMVVSTKVEIDKTNEDTSKGKKYSKDKLDYTLIPPYALEELARHYTVGLRKYPDRDNWKKVPNARLEYLKAAHRHFQSFMKGNKYDPEGLEPDLHELTCVIFNLMALVEFDLNPNLKEIVNE